MSCRYPRRDLLGSWAAESRRIGRQRPGNRHARPRKVRREERRNRSLPRRARRVPAHCNAGKLQRTSSAVMSRDQVERLEDDRDIAAAEPRERSRQPSPPRCSARSSPAITSSCSTAIAPALIRPMFLRPSDRSLGSAAEGVITFTGRLVIARALGRTNAAERPVIVVLGDLLSAGFGLRRVPAAASAQADGLPWTNHGRPRRLDWSVPGYPRR